MTTIPASRRIAADLALIGLAVMWGATFPLGKFILDYLAPFGYLSLRFSLATLLLLPFAVRRGGGLPWRTWRWALLVGAALFGGYAFQTTGLRIASATLSAFITALSVVLVPVFGAFWGRKPTTFEWLGVGCATAGLGLLTLQGATRPGLGELLLLGCAVCFAWHILFLDRVSGEAHPLVLGWAQAVMVALLAGALVPTEPRPVAVPPVVGWSVAGMGVVASAAAFSIMAWAQRYTHPTHAGLCLAVEPVAAALFARWFTGELLTGRQWAGAGLILLGIVLAEVRARPRQA
jgi:drug/metabolite transporter (DMT)-like permease